MSNEDQTRTEYYLQQAESCLRDLLKDFCRKLHSARFVIEVIGVIVLAFYTYETRQIFLDGTRPAVAVRGLDPSGCVCADLRNSGRNTAVAKVTYGSGFSPTQLSGGPPLTDSEKLIIPPGETDNRIDFRKPGLPTNRNCGYFYLSGRIDYGDGYYTRFCREYGLTLSGHTEELCEDPDTNDNN